MLNSALSPAPSALLLRAPLASPGPRPRWVRIASTPGNGGSRFQPSSRASTRSFCPSPMPFVIQAFTRANSPSPRRVGRPRQRRHRQAPRQCIRRPPSVALGETTDRNRLQMRSTAPSSNRPRTASNASTGPLHERKREALRVTADRGARGADRLICGPHHPDRARSSRTGCSVRVEGKKLLG